MTQMYVDLIRKHVNRTHSYMDSESCQGHIKWFPMMELSASKYVKTKGNENNSNVIKITRLQSCCTDLMIQNIMLNSNKNVAKSTIKSFNRILKPWFVTQINWKYFGVVAN